MAERRSIDGTQTAIAVRFLVFCDRSQHNK